MSNPTHTHICKHAHRGIRTHTNAHVNTHACTHTHKHTHTRTRTHTHARMHTHTHTHTHMHTHTQRSRISIAHFALRIRPWHRLGHFLLQPAGEGWVGEWEPLYDNGWNTTKQAVVRAPWREFNNNECAYGIVLSSSCQLCPSSQSYSLSLFLIDRGFSILVSSSSSSVSSSESPQNGEYLSSATPSSWSKRFCDDKRLSISVRDLIRGFPKYSSYVTSC